MFKSSAPKNHPRYWSLYYRDLLAWGVQNGITSLQGLTSHGRGEAFDYLIGEKTNYFAVSAIKCAAASLILAQKPVISVNGNTAVLVPRELIRLARIVPAQLEINIFHKGKNREGKISVYLKKMGAGNVLLPDRSLIAGLTSNRRFVSGRGQKIADTVFVPLEDGDRTEKLIAMGKKVITVDLNPLSRTAQKATVTIVDNIVRTVPLLTDEIARLKKYPPPKLEGIILAYDNKKIIGESISFIKLKLADMGCSSFPS